MPTRRKQPDPQPLPARKQQPATMQTKDDLDVSDTESYFSSKHEPEYLTRLTLAVANGARRRRRPFRHHIRPIKHGEYANDGPTSPATTISTFSLKSGETGFRYLVSDDSVEVAEDCARRIDSPKDRPATASTRRQRSNSGASDALPQIQAPSLVLPDSRYTAYDDLDSDSDDDSLKSLEAGFLSPHQQRRGPYDGQRHTSSSQRLRGYALRPSKSTVNISSPALANRLGVPLSAELEVWVDDLKK
ncbi:hypothetical protein M409DRAFT_16644 [Zasmidium cellare ATCC 36951]|uniref:Uncharacterized protein n=1 Tax=Zasmidium cellare ATCC 36951 TaxID=1080233 RepID=A0A6A6D3C3_ZASCE|nr:uncharacterized protein M409DRAFT_16644 [Zasmidium cellare ATCC 36951]KAF2172682.1 hypothetical protein M409DRAFT_16644 [Zasmidium cellare ATCC 36951]